MSEIPMGGPGIPLAPDAPGGPGAPGSPPGAADEILVAFAEPAEQRRLTVLVRIILAIPHAIVLYVLGIASDVVALDLLVRGAVQRPPARRAGRVPGRLRALGDPFLRVRAPAD